MKFARLRLILAAILFAGWMGWLGYLALEHRKPVIVSRSQLLIATHLLKCDLAIKADDKGQPTAAISNPDWLDKQPAPNGPFVVENLDKAQLSDGKRLTSLPIGSFGSYLLLLEGGPQRYRIVGASEASGSNSGPPFLIYPWSSSVERQIHD